MPVPARWARGSTRCHVCVTSYPKEVRIRVFLNIARRHRMHLSIEIKRKAYLDRFRSVFGDRLGKSYVLCTKDIRTEGDIIMLPLYMAMLL